ncbi:MAG: alpha/beta hydrolase [Pseudomonadota bacterium]
MVVLEGPRPQAHALKVSSQSLTCWRFPDVGGAGRPRLVMLHGMRDVARGLLPVAWPLTERFELHLYDLRGHGASARSDVYSLYQYYFDVYTLLAELRRAPEPLYLFGHSLGGQLAARIAGLFPELVDGLVLAEGLGPPRPNWNQALTSEDEDVKALRAQLLDRFSLTASLRPLPDTEFAAARLRANNPRLSAEQALLTATVATRRNESGELHWDFDPRVATVFVGFDEGESARLWRQVTCPVLTITGDCADEYWRSLYPGGTYSGHFQPGEYEARISAFRTIEHKRFEHSGHMVHFDEPDRLAAAIQDFLTQR